MGWKSSDLFIRMMIVPQRTNKELLLGKKHGREIVKRGRGGNKAETVGLWSPATSRLLRSC